MEDCGRACHVCEDQGLRDPPLGGRHRNHHRERAAHEIRRLVRRYNKHPYDINNGDCADFADELAAALGDGAEAIDLPEEWAHSCVRYQGRYYDAEEPYGVKHWRQLPLCVRGRRK